MESLHAFIETKTVSDKVSVIGVCGLAGAGKTTLCKAILEAYPDIAQHFVCDRFSRYDLGQREARIAKAIAEDPSPEAEENPLHWYAWADIGNALGSLRKVRAFTYERGWNRQTGKLDERYEITLPHEGPALVLCDGIFLLHSPVRQWLDAAILVDTPLSMTLDRGRRRSDDAPRREYMERLTRVYSVPYFAMHASEADLVYPSETNPQT